MYVYIYMNKCIQIYTFCFNIPLRENVLHEKFHSYLH